MILLVPVEHVSEPIVVFELIVVFKLIVVFELIVVFALVRLGIGLLMAVSDGASRLCSRHIHDG